MTNEQFQEITTPFIQLAHCFRIGDKIYGDKFLFLCSKLLAKYYVTYQNKELLHHLLKMVNESYRREDYIALADILEHDIPAYLKSELV
ncbi:hypothetical protein [Vibrio algivorus]|uniref:Uncharacterized protein n=1 Tax=Vibrio algivorus TaxID=1667024 RepID=A0A557P530_9VIBR|nr:hypothetical protein [Vibrio algivorus]TVO35727.1 hypothetical protein FOF44_11615 [Vibrio algivorus]